MPDDTRTAVEQAREAWERVRTHPMRHIGEATHPERGTLACVTLYAAEQIVVALESALAAERERADKAEAERDRLRWVAETACRARCVYAGGPEAEEYLAILIDSYATRELPEGDGYNGHSEDCSCDACVEASMADYPEG